LSNKELAMSSEDLIHIQKYFTDESRNPTETEIKMLDTYWSDHCRHTTFETEITSIKFPDDKLGSELEKEYNEYLKLRDKTKSKRPISLMDMATIYGKYLYKSGRLSDLEVSEEINACSVYIDVDVDGKNEEWLLMFKNETHNHPTEIEPFGGASTCVGGAIRDPLSGRSFVYQAMRVTGKENPLADISETIEGKLPQRVISKVATEGYSSYGNQIGLATTHVREVYHPGYLAKHMEVGAVVGACRKDQVVRKTPQAGDIVIMLGGRTGRDGIGGATGSSKVHTTKSIETASAEVQKGNAVEERKIQRLFRNPDVTKLIKKANDFGAGGVSVAVGELADGLKINLDNVRTKYDGLNGTELAISESQERMAVVIDATDKEEFIDLCKKENIEAYKIADVTDDFRLTMYWRGKKIVDLIREFIDTNGVRQFTQIEIAEADELISEDSNLLTHLSKLNIATQKGMGEYFDSTVGASTVLMPYGGKYQATPTQGSIHKLPVLNGETKTASIMTFGYNPYISKASPFHGSQYAVIESLAKTVACGGDYKKVRFSFQEYFERLTDEVKWGKPFASLLGALRAQREFGLPAIGGKDSMSGTFKDIHVPPTLISFAVSTVNVDNVISNEFKEEDNYIYLIKHNPVKGYPNYSDLIANFNYLQELINDEVAVTAYAVEHSISSALVKASLGNEVGFNIETDLDLYSYDYGSFIIETNKKLKYGNAILLGKTCRDIVVNGIEYSFEDIKNALSTFDYLYPVIKENEGKLTKTPTEMKRKFKKQKLEVVKVFVPVFPGMNSEYDTIRAFERAGGTVSSKVFNNQSKEDINRSIDEFASQINNANIVAFSGGFSQGDEPDGSGKFLANVIKNKKISNALNKLLERDGLLLGICNGFQALVNSGYLPGDGLDAILFRNDINRHISHIATTKVITTESPWLKGFKEGMIQKVAVSHGEGKFVASEETLDKLFRNGQVAFQYANDLGEVTMDGMYNPNGSYEAIEGIISACGKVLGKMGHPERYSSDTFKNIPGDKNQNIFENAIKYFKGE